MCLIRCQSSTAAALTKVVDRRDGVSSPAPLVSVVIKRNQAGVKMARLPGRRGRRRQRRLRSFVVVSPPPARPSVRPQLSALGRRLGFRANKPPSVHFAFATPRSPSVRRSNVYRRGAKLFRLNNSDRMSVSPAYGAGGRG